MPLFLPVKEKRARVSVCKGASVLALIHDSRAPTQDSRAGLCLHYLRHPNNAWATRRRQDITLSSQFCC
jgi:hypothetical protein